ncbi:MAG: molybdenum cofactor guanylyltransferase MobA [Hyphomicrobiaceae bacterium]
MPAEPALAYVHVRPALAGDASTIEADTDPMSEHAPPAIIVGVILAGGTSRRMGGSDKSLLSFGASSLVGEVARRLRPQVTEVVLNANGDPHRFAELGLPVAADLVAGFPGPLAGLHAGMRWAVANVAGATHVLSVPSDAPFIPRDLAQRFAEALGASGGKSRVAVASSAGKVHPVIGLWPIGLAEDLGRALDEGQRKVMTWATHCGALVVDFPLRRVAGHMIDPFYNANTPAELDEARRLLELAGHGSD